jgi:hemerythrin-like domain-containing protein
MEATEILSSEHRVIERVLTSLEKAAMRLENGEPFRPGFFIQATDFIRGFADGCHHKKEEGVLFTSMREWGVPQVAGPVGMMMAEHEQGRAYTRTMRSAAERLEAGDSLSQIELVTAAQNYVSLLREHIYKEDNILFPLAQRVIPVAEQSKVLEGFENLEHEETGEGVHEKFLALAEALAHEAGS